MIMMMMMSRRAFCSSFIALRIHRFCMDTCWTNFSDGDKSYCAVLHGETWQWQATTDKWINAMMPVYIGYCDVQLYMYSVSVCCWLSVGNLSGSSISSQAITITAKTSVAYIIANIDISYRIMKSDVGSSLVLGCQLWLLSADARQMYRKYQRAEICHGSHLSTLAFFSTLHALLQYLSIYTFPLHPVYFLLCRHSN